MISSSCSPTGFRIEEVNESVVPCCAVVPCVEVCTNVHQRLVIRLRLHGPYVRPASNDIRLAFPISILDLYLYYSCDPKSLGRSEPVSMGGSPVVVALQQTELLQGAASTIDFDLRGLAAWSGDLTALQANGRQDSLEPQPSWKNV